MNNIVNKFLLKGDNFMPELHLGQPGLGKYAACGPFTKPKNRISKCLEIGDLDYIYKNDLDEACFQHDITYGNYQDSPRRTKSDLVLRDNAYKIVYNRSKDIYQRGLATILYKFFDKKAKS